MRLSRRSPSTIAILATLAACALAVAVASRTDAADDGRQVIPLESVERDFVLAEMRGFLQSIEGIVAAVASDRVADAEAPDRKIGMGVMHDVPPTLPHKLPKEFKMMGRATHQAFDALADEAKTMGDKSAVLKQLEQILKTCNTCHASYRLSGG